MGVKLFGAIGALTIAGVEVAKGKDGSFDVPEEVALEMKQAFGLRDTADEPVVAQPDVPAEVHEAAIDEANAAIAVAKEGARAAMAERDKLAAQVADLQAQLASAGSKRR